jgi:hypothetical protein
MGRLVHRHRAGVAVGTGFVAILIGVVILTLVQSARIARARDRTEQEAAKSRAVTEFLQQTLGSADPMGGLGRDVTVVEALAIAAGRIEESFEDQPEVEAALNAG